MRNRYPGQCYRCNTQVAPGAGHFERVCGKWLTQHAECAIKYRGTEVGVDLEARHRQREFLAQRQIEIWKVKARGTGSSANKARRALRLKNITWEIKDDKTN